MNKVYIFLFFFVFSSQLYSKEETNLIQVIMDNSGALQHPEKAKEYKLKLLKKISRLRKNKEFKNSKIKLITMHKTTNLWVGSPKELYKIKKDDVKKYIGVTKNGCSDLVASINKAALNLELENYPKNKLYIFSSMFHTGVPCGGKVSETIPEGIHYDKLLKSDIEIFIYWVDFRQQEKWIENLKKKGFSDFEVMSDGHGDGGETKGFFR